MASTDAARHTGRVKKWFAGKGFGFIARKGEQDIFVHVSALSSELQRLADGGQLEGVEVAFEVTKTSRGLAAVKVNRPGDGAPVIEDFLLEGDAVSLGLWAIENRFELVWKNRSQNQFSGKAATWAIVCRDSAGLFMATRNTRLGRARGLPSIVTRDHGVIRRECRWKAGGEEVVALLSCAGKKEEVSDEETR